MDSLFCRTVLVDPRYMLKGKGKLADRISRCQFSTQPRWLIWLACVFLWNLGCTNNSENHRGKKSRSAAGGAGTPSAEIVEEPAGATGGTQGAASSNSGGRRALRAGECWSEELVEGEPVEVTYTDGPIPRALSGNLPEKGVFRLTSWTRYNVPEEQQREEAHRAVFRFRGSTVDTIVDGVEMVGEWALGSGNGEGHFFVKMTCPQSDAGRYSSGYRFTAREGSITFISAEDEVFTLVAETN
jgi:hypothetical protein